jgi:uncharacterized protein with GYD domain
MVDILHRVGIKSSSNDATYGALSACAGLAQWWTTDTTGESVVDEVLKFRFGNGGFDMKVLELVPGRYVLWQVICGPEDWVGTKISFELRHDGNYTVVLFKHMGWKEPTELMHACSTKWAMFLMSLKSLIETGKGAPWPHDVKIYDVN